MITKKEIEKLAALSRLSLTDEEKEKYLTEMESILGYIDMLKKVSLKNDGPIMTRNRNVMRDDNGAHETGIYTDKLLALSPKRNGDYVEVKKIL